MVDDNLSLDQTSAGQHFGAELRKAQEKHEKAMAALKVEMQDAIAESDFKNAEVIRKEREAFAAQVAQGKDDRAKMAKGLEDIQKQQVEDILRMQEQYESNVTALQEKVQELKGERQDLDGMDPSSSTAVALRQHIAKDEAEVIEIQRSLVVQDETMRKKAKSMYTSSLRSLIN